MRKTVVIVQMLLSVFFLSPSLLAGSDANCYLDIENTDKIEPEIVKNLSATLISKYINKIRPIPSSGVSAKACLYHVSIKKSDETLLVTVSGRKINGIGESKKSGFNGIQEAILSAIYNGSKAHRHEICRDFGGKIKEKCRQQTSPIITRPPQIDLSAFKQHTGKRQKGICSVLQSNRSYSHCNLEKKHYKNLNLEGADFSGVNLSKSHFNNCNLSNVIFKNSNLEKSVFLDSTLSGAILDSVNMQKSRFNQSDISQSSFINTNLEKASFKSASLNQLIMINANLQKANFEKATLNQVDMTGANLEDARFKGATLNQVNLTNANLEDVDLGQATLNDVIR